MAKPRNRFAWGLIGTLSLVTVQGAAQTDQQRAGARALAQQGLEAYSAGRWSDAVDLFDRAEKLVHALPHLLYLARSNASLGRLVEARELYLRIGREPLAAGAPPAFTDAKREAAQELQALEPRIPNVTIKLAGPGLESAKVTLNGEDVDPALVGVARPLNPGTYRAIATSPTSRSTEQLLQVAEGSRQEFVLELAPVAATPAPVGPVAPAAPPKDTGTTKAAHPYRIPAYVGFGVGAVGLGVGTYFLIDRSGKKSDADDRFSSCRDRGDCDDSDISAIKGLDDDAATAGTMAIVGYSVGVAGIGAGIALLILDSKASSASNQATIRPWFDQHQIGVMGRF